MEYKATTLQEGELEEILQHFGIKGMRWGVRRDRGPDGTVGGTAKEKITETVYAIGAKTKPRELKYAAQRKLTKHTESDTQIAGVVNAQTKATGILTTNPTLIKTLDKEGIKAHKAAVYDNLNKTDIERFKKYTDSAAYSRTVNTFLATGEPQKVSEKAQALKDSLGKNTVDNQIVYRSTNLKFSSDGISKKLDAHGEKALAETFNSFEKNFKGKSFKENRVYSTSTSPSFAIDTWRKVNPTAAKTYNAYMVIECKKCPGVLADGRTANKQSIVNTKSNQEAILAPNKMTYRKLAFDAERQMFVVYLDATGG